MERPTLEAYQLAERKAAREEGRRGFLVHASITVVVAIVLVVLNVTIATGFPWSVFAVAGMGIGVFMHWYFGLVRGEELMQRHQQDVERRTAA